MNVSKITNVTELKNKLKKSTETFEKRYPKNITDISYLKHAQELINRNVLNEQVLEETITNPKSVVTLNIAHALAIEKEKDSAFENKFYKDLEERLATFKKNNTQKDNLAPVKKLDEKINPDTLFKQALEQKNLMALFLDANDKAQKKSMEARLTDLEGLSKKINFKEETLTSGHQLASESLTILRTMEQLLNDLPEEQKQTVDTETVEYIKHYILTGEFKGAKKGLKNGMERPNNDQPQTQNNQPHTMIELLQREITEPSTDPHNTAQRELALVERNLTTITTFDTENQALISRIWRVLRALTSFNTLRAFTGRLPGRMLMVGTLTAILAGVTIILNHALSYGLMAALDFTGQQGENVLENPARFGLSVALTVIYALVSFGMVVRTALQTWSQHETSSGFQWFGNIARIFVCVASMFSVIASVAPLIQAGTITLGGMAIVVNFIAVIAGHILPRRIVEGLLVRVNPLAGHPTIWGAGIVSVIMAFVFMPTIFVLNLGGPQLYVNRNTTSFIDNLSGDINLDIGAGNILRGALGFTATEILGPLFMSILLNIGSPRDIVTNLRESWNRLTANGYPDNAPTRQRLRAYFDFHRAGRPSEEGDNTPNYIEVGPVNNNWRAGLTHAANESVNTAMLFQTMLGVGAVVFVGATGLAAATANPWHAPIVLGICIGFSLFFLLCAAIARPTQVPANEESGVSYRF